MPRREEAHGKATCPWCNERSEVVWDSDPSIGWQWKELTFGCPRCDEYVVLNEIGRTALDFVETTERAPLERIASALERIAEHYDSERRWKRFPPCTCGRGIGPHPTHNVVYYELFGEHRCTKCALSDEDKEITSPCVPEPHD